jgi:hypothetical protein
MTNFERIKAMSLDEMVELFKTLRDCDGMCDDCIRYDRKNSNCLFTYTREYLESEVEE